MLGAGGRRHQAAATCPPPARAKGAPPRRDWVGSHGSMVAYTERSAETLMAPHEGGGGAGGDIPHQPFSCLQPVELKRPVGMLAAPPGRLSLWLTRRRLGVLLGGLRARNQPRWQLVGEICLLVRQPFAINLPSKGLVGTSGRLNGPGTGSARPMLADTGGIHSFGQLTCAGLLLCALVPANMLPNIVCAL